MKLLYYSLYLTLGIFNITSSATAEIIYSENPEDFVRIEKLIDKDCDEKYLNQINNEKPTLFVFWAEWCPFCKNTIKSIDKLSKKLEGKINIIPIAEGCEKQEVKKHYKKNDITTLKVCLDKNLKYKKILNFTLPSSFLVNKEGKIAVKFIGSQIDWEQVEKILEGYY